MKFYDKVKIEIQSGAGGNGTVSGRREAKVPFGGPAGGDGGKGGDIIFISSKDENTLLKYRYKKIFKAKSGEPGGNKDKYGKSGEDLILKVPIGTLIKDNLSGKNLFQFTKDNQEFTIIRGGRGGWGNIHFKNSINQYPEFALFGEPSRKLNLTLELQLLGDICLIGTPSVGKSTIINSVSNAKAKVADYPFTTITPNLGMVNHHEKDFCIVDVPGLVEGANEGKGLGFEFLRHVLKGNNWAFVLDISRYDQGISDLSLLWKEILEYLKVRFIGSNEFGEKIEKLEFITKEEKTGILFRCNAIFDNGEEKEILKKYVTIIINKIDLIRDDDIVQEYKYELIKEIKNIWGKDLKNIEEYVILISGATKEGIEEFLNKCYEIIISNIGVNEFVNIEKNKIELSEKPYIKNITEIELEYLMQEGYIEEKFNGNVREIYNPEFAYFCYILPWGNTQAEMRFWDKIKKEGLLSGFFSKGIKQGDIFKIMNDYGNDPIYIQYSL